MNECICNNCKNLKGIIDEDGVAKEYVCEYGFPSENCSSCEAEECEVSCCHYVCEDDPEDNTMIVSCKGCGKELRQTCSSDEEGAIYCVTCYLDRS